MKLLIGNTYKAPNQPERPIIGVTAERDGAYAIYLSVGPEGVARAIVAPNGYVTTPRFEGRVHWWEDYRHDLCVESISHPFA